MTSSQPAIPLGTTATAGGADQAVAFISYAREDRTFVTRLAEALTLKDVLVRGDWQLVRGENYQTQLDGLQLGADAIVFIVSPDSVASAPCLAELERAVTQNKLILPVVHRDPGVAEGDLPSALALPQWTFLRTDDDFVGGVQALVEAISTDFELMPQHRRLLQAAETWQRNERGASYLLRRDGLKRAEEWLARTNRQSNKLPRPTALEADYIQASRVARTRGARTAVSVAIGISIAMAVLAIVAFVQRKEATRQATIATDQAGIARKEEAHARAQELIAIEQARIADENRQLAEKRRAEAELATETERAARAVVLAQGPGHEAEALSVALLAASNGMRAPGTLLRAAVIEGLAAAVRAARSSLPLGGHADEVEAAAFSPDGARLLTEDKAGLVVLWDAADGRRIASFDRGGRSETNPARLSGASFSGDSRQFVVSRNQVGAPNRFAIEIRAAASGALLRSLEGHRGQILSVRFSPDSSQILSASVDETARVWNAQDGTLVRVIEAPSQTRWGAVYRAVYSGDGSKVFTRHQDNRVRVWNAQTGVSIDVETSRADPVALRFLTGRPITLPPHSRLAYRLGELSADDATLVTRSGNQLQLHDLRTAEPVKPIYGHFGEEYEGHSGDLNSTAFSPDGRLLVSASQDGTARVWDAVHGSLLSVLRGHADRVWYATFSPDGRRVATASADRTARLWNPHVDPSLLTLGAQAVTVTPTDHEQSVEAAAFSPDGASAATGHGDGHVRLWDVRSGRRLAALDSAGPVEYVAFSPDGSRLVAVTAIQTSLWDVRAKRAVATVPGTGRKVPGPADDAAAFSPDGQRLAVATQDGWLLLDSRTGRILRRDTQKATSALYSPLGRQVALAGWSEVVLKDATTSASVVIALNGRSNFVAFSRDGSQVVAPYWAEANRPALPNPDWAVQIRESRSGGLLHTLQGHRAQVESAAFSPDGTRVVTAGADHVARIWDARSGASLLTLQHSAVVRSAIFSPQGTEVLTSSDDNLVFLWDAQTGNRLATLSGHTGAVYSAAFSPDGLRLMTASQDGSAKIYAVSRAALIKEYLAAALRLVRQQQIDVEMVRRLDGEVATYVPSLDASSPPAPQAAATAARTR